MCLALPGRIVEFLEGGKDFARVDVAGVRRAINVGLVTPDGLEVGDWVLIHVGFALSRIDESEALRTIALLQQLGGLYDDEVQQLRDSAT